MVYEVRCHGIRGTLPWYTRYAAMVYEVRKPTVK